jgi:hypothetical protein
MGIFIIRSESRMDDWKLSSKTKYNNGDPIKIANDK